MSAAYTCLPASLPAPETLCPSLKLPMTMGSKALTQEHKMKTGEPGQCLGATQHLISGLMEKGWLQALTTLMYGECEEFSSLKPRGSDAEGHRRPKVFY